LPFRWAAQKGLGSLFCLSVEAFGDTVINSTCVETSEPATVQIVDLDGDGPDIMTFDTVAQTVKFDEEPDDPAADALLNHEVMSDPLTLLFRPE